MTEPKVINVDRMDGDVVVSFEDGVIALYSATLLRDLLPQAQVFPEAEEEPEDEGSKTRSASLEEIS